MNYQDWLEDSVKYSVSKTLHLATRSSIRYSVWFRVQTPVWVPVEASVLYPGMYSVVDSVRVSIVASIEGPLP